MIVGIHQPNFFPWLGFFNKIYLSDVFVFMDDVAYPKSGNSMGGPCNRVKMLTQGQSVWVKCGVVREHGRQLIKNVKINIEIPWREKLLKTLYMNYKRAPKFNKYWEWIKSLVNYSTQSLAEYNIHCICEIARKLGIDTKLVCQSDLKTKNSSTDVLVEIVKKVGGDTYLCGGGAGGYQEDEKIIKAGIKLTYQSYHHPVYPQITTKEFVPGLSILDALMNVGKSGVKALVESHPSQL